MPVAGQVADLLRERLQSLGSELLEAKARVTEVESAQAADREALRTSNVSLSNSSKYNCVVVSHFLTISHTSGSCS